MLKQSDSSGFVIGTYRHGLYHFDGKEINPFTPGPQTQKLLNGRYIFLGENLKNGDWALQLLPNTLIITDPEGRLKQVLNKDMGLRDDLVWDLEEDHQGGLWLALNDGLARVKMHSPITRFDERLGMGRTINAIIRHEDELYFGSQNALLKLNKPQNIESIAKIDILSELTGQASSFVPFQSDLLVSGSVNPLKINGPKIEKIFSAGTTLIYPSKYDPNISYVAFADGLKIYRHDRQMLSGKIKLDQLVLSIEEEKPGFLWLGIENGLIKLELSPSHLNNPSRNKEIIPLELQSFNNKDHGLSYWNQPIKIDDKILFGTKNGIKSFDSESQSFSPDLTLGDKFADTMREVYRVFQTKEKEFWVISFINKGKLQIDRLTPGKDGKFVSETKPYEKLKELGTIFSIYPDPKDKNIIWFGGTNGVIRYDTAIEDEISHNIPAMISGVIFQDSIILHGGAYLPPELARKPITIDYSTSSIRFEYAIPIFEDADKIEFQYTLEGFEKNWSIWTKKTEKEYGNLPEGNYTFKVRARDMYGNISPEGSIKLKVFPPWYRTWWAFILYAILLMLFIVMTVYFSIQWRLQKLKARNEELEETVEKRTIEIKEKNVQLAESLDHLKQTQEQLIMQEKMASLGQLSLGIAHEIKNPLNFVNNFAVSSVEVAEELREELVEMLTTRPEEERKLITELLGEISEYVGLIKEHGVRADGIVSSMMNHANDTQGEHLEIYLNDLVDEQANLGLKGFKIKNEGFNGELSMDLAPNLPQLNINPQEFGRVIVNLINNACFAIKEKRKVNNQPDYIPKIKVKTKLSGDKVEIRVWDNGIGIPEKNRNQIFQPFFTTKPTGEGNIGLGLSISYDIITKGHGGEIKVDSKEGEYTEFIVSLSVK